MPKVQMLAASLQSITGIVIVALKGYNIPGGIKSFIQNIQLTVCCIIREMSLILNFCETYFIQEYNSVNKLYHFQLLPNQGWTKIMHGILPVSIPKTSNLLQPLDSVPVPQLLVTVVTVNKTTSVQCRGNIIK